MRTSSSEMRGVPAFLLRSADSRTQLTLWAAVALLGLLSFALSVTALLRPIPVSTSGGNPGGSVLDQAIQSRVLRVGCPCDYAPFAAATCGSDIDAARSLAASLGASLELVPSTWASLLDDMEKRRLDLAVGGITDTLPRRRRAFVSTAYHADAKVVVARCGNPLLAMASLGGAAIAAVAGVHFAVNPGGTNEAVARELGLQLALVERNGDQFLDVLAGVSNATLTDGAEAELWSRRYTGRLCASDATLTRAQPKVYLLPRGDTPWQQYVNGWLAQRIGAGAMNASFDSWVDRFARSDAAQLGGSAADACALERRQAGR